MTSATSNKLAVVFGTRPEVLKLGSLISALRAVAKIPLYILSTGQHRELSLSALSTVGFSPNTSLDLMRSSQLPHQFVAGAISAITPAIQSEKCTAVLVQGDTASALAGSLAGFHLSIPVIHVEAGLRSGDLRAPFPEEGYRRLISSISALHLAPTEHAKANLLHEGIRPEAIRVTGNTIVSALEYYRAQRRPPLVEEAVRSPPRKQILVTLHRRESHGDTLRGILIALREIADKHSTASILFPVHPNPAVRGIAHEILAGHERIALVEPLDYQEFLCAIESSYLILTDSGGIQEEAPYFGIPVVVARDTTDRPESVASGNAILAGTHAEQIKSTVLSILNDQKLHSRMAVLRNPFGDGTSATRCAEAITEFLSNLSPH